MVQRLPFKSASGRSQESLGDDTSRSSQRRESDAAASPSQLAEKGPSVSRKSSFILSTGGSLGNSRAEQQTLSSRTGEESYGLGIGGIRVTRETEVPILRTVGGLSNVVTITPPRGRRNVSATKENTEVAQHLRFRTKPPSGDRPRSWVDVSSQHEVFPPPNAQCRLPFADAATGRKATSAYSAALNPPRLPSESFSPLTVPIPISQDFSVTPFKSSSNSSSSRRSATFVSHGSQSYPKQSPSNHTILPSLTPSSPPSSPPKAFSLSPPSVLPNSYSVASVMSFDSVISLPPRGVGVVGANGLVSAAFQTRKISAAPWEEEEREIMSPSLEGIRGGRTEAMKDAERRIKLGLGLSKGWRERIEPRRSTSPVLEKQASDSFLQRLQESPKRLQLERPIFSELEEEEDEINEEDYARSIVQSDSSDSSESIYLDARAESPIASWKEATSPPELENTTRKSASHHPMVDYSRQPTNLWIFDPFPSGLERLSVVVEETEYEDSVASRPQSSRRDSLQPLAQSSKRNSLQPYEVRLPVFAEDDDFQHAFKTSLDATLSTPPRPLPSTDCPTSTVSYQTVPYSSASPVAPQTSSLTSSFTSKIGSLFRKQSLPALDLSRGLSSDSMSRKDVSKGYDRRSESRMSGNRPTSGGSQDEKPSLAWELDDTTSLLSEDGGGLLGGLGEGIWGTASSLPSTPQVHVLKEKFGEFEREERMRIKSITRRRSFALE